MGDTPADVVTVMLILAGIVGLALMGRFGAPFPPAHHHPPMFAGIIHYR